MALDDLLNGVHVPSSLAAVVMVILNGVILAHVVGGPFADKVVDAIIWSAALAAAVVLLRTIAFRRAHWRKIWEWTAVTLVVIDLVAAALIKLAGPA